MKTNELTDALLDYWVARAEGVPAAELEIRQIPIPEHRHLSPDGMTCTRNYHDGVDYSTDWAQGGPLIEKHELKTRKCGDGWFVSGDSLAVCGAGATLLQAVCRAVVRGKFGDEVPDL